MHKVLVKYIKKMWPNLEKMWQGLTALDAFARHFKSCLFNRACLWLLQTYKVCSVLLLQHNRKYTSNLTLVQFRWAYLVFYRNMSHAFSTACLLVCLYVVHILWCIITLLSETYKTKGETFVIAKEQLIFPAKVMAKEWGIEPAAVPPFFFLSFFLTEIQTSVNGNQS